MGTEDGGCDALDLFLVKNDSQENVNDHLPSTNQFDSWWPFLGGSGGDDKSGERTRRGERQKGVSSMIVVKTTVSIYQELA